MCERYIHQLPLTPLTADLAHNPGMWPDKESSLRPFGLQAVTQSTEPHQSGLLPAFNRREIEGCLSGTLVSGPLVPLPLQTWNLEVTLSCHLWGHFPCCRDLTPFNYSLPVLRSQGNGGNRKRWRTEERERQGSDWDLMWYFLTSLS